jgi:hypothetical protein
MNPWFSTLKTYRTHCRTETVWKHQTLSYNFHLDIVCRPSMKYLGLTDAMKWDDVNPDLLAIPDVARSAMIYLFARLMVANQSSFH